MPRYANMSDAEAEAWERGGGAWRGASLRGTVYGVQPPPRSLPPPLPQTDWQRTAPDREPLPDWPIEPVLEALQRERDQQRAAPIPTRVRPSPFTVERLDSRDVRFTTGPAGELLEVERYAVRDYPDLDALMLEQAPAADALKREAEVTLHPTRAGTHGTLAAYLAGDRCLDCTNAANEAAMLGTWTP